MKFYGTYPSVFNCGRTYSKARNLIFINCFSEAFKTNCVYAKIIYNKVKTYTYKVDFPFHETIACTIVSLIIQSRSLASRKCEKEVSSDGSKVYSMNTGSCTLPYRGTDSTFLGAITLGIDTLVFRTIYVTPKTDPGISTDKNIP